MALLETSFNNYTLFFTNEYFRGNKKEESIALFSKLRESSIDFDDIIFYEKRRTIFEEFVNYREFIHELMDNSISCSSIHCVNPQLIYFKYYTVPYIKDGSNYKFNGVLDLVVSWCSFLNQKSIGADDYLILIRK